MPPDRAPRRTPGSDLRFAYAFSARKRVLLSRFLGGARVRPVADPRAVPDGATLYVWGQARVPADVAERCALTRVEDGLLRSVGLGSELARPVSWAFDRSGIYFDATAPSDLETILQTADVDADLAARARALRARIVAARLTKYNVGSGGWRRPRGVARVLLVTGQAEGDASLRWGLPLFHSNLDLLRHVRAVAPEGYLVYKPHPDVVAGLRRGGDDAAAIAATCDEVVADAPIDLLYDQIDELHTRTSASGFEALLRGRVVYTYGVPFYAGWGLTRDATTVQRRDRQLSIDELVAGALIRYPAYGGAADGAALTAEMALDELIARRARRAQRTHLGTRIARAAIRSFVGVH